MRGPYHVYSIIIVIFVCSRLEMWGEEKEMEGGSEALPVVATIPPLWPWLLRLFPTSRSLILYYDLVASL
jgi:hypothetical protein